MKIENFEGTLDTFSFPHNSRVFDDGVGKFVDEKDIPYHFTYFGTTMSIKSKRDIVISGHFDGSNKEADYRALSKHVNSNQLKKFFFDDDKFFVVIPKTCKRTHSGGRTNFIDYVANFVSPFGLLFGKTLKSGSNSSAEKNEGNVDTPILEITGSVTGGTAVVINDKDGNGFEFNPSATGSMTLSLIKMVDLGGEMFFSEYLYCVVGSAKQVLNVSDVTKSMFLKLGSDESLSTLFGGGTISGVSSLLFKFRDGYSSD